MEEGTGQKRVLRVAFMALRTKTAKMRVTMAIDAFGTTSGENLFSVLAMTGFTGQKVVMPS